MVFIIFALFLGPGPARYTLPPTYGYGDHDITKQRLPCYTMGGPQKTNPKSEGPGPARYDISLQNPHGRRRYPGYVGIQLQNLSITK